MDRSHKRISMDGGDEAARQLAAVENQIKQQQQLMAENGLAQHSQTDANFAQDYQYALGSLKRNQNLSNQSVIADKINDLLNLGKFSVAENCYNIKFSWQLMRMTHTRCTRLITVRTRTPSFRVGRRSRPP